jgi:DNA-directed RNA polymerase subunit RPC12/RpoP
MSDIKFACPQCQQHIQCEEGYGGMEIACPACSTRIIVPRPVGAPAIAPAPAMAPPPVPPPAPALARSSAPGAAAAGCPSCGNPMPRGAVLCTNCGYNTVTRKRTVAGRVVAPGRPKAARPEGVAGWFKTPYPYLCLFVIVLGVLYLLGQNNPVLLLAFALLAGFYMLGMWITTAVFAFKDSVVKGFLCLCIGVYAIYWVYKESDNSFLKAAYGVLILLWLILMVAGKVHKFSPE